MTSRERVERVLSFEMPDRTPVYDLIQNKTYTEDRFDFDIALSGHRDTEASRPKNKFRMLAAIGPFEDVSCAFGMEPFKFFQLLF